MSNRSSMRGATSLSELTSSASSILFLDPSMLIRSGIEYSMPFFAERGFSNNRAGPGTLTGMAILVETPQEVGADRIADAVAAYEKYGGPCIVVDLGTAYHF